MSTRRARRPAQREDSPPKLATVTEHPARRRVRPKSLVEAVDGSERDVLVALRAKIAGRLDAEVPTHAVAQLVRMFRDVDAQIRAINETARASAEQESDDQEVDEPAGWDKSQI